MTIKPEKIEDLKKSVPVIFGHRGFKSKYPENTMVSFLEAFKTGAPAIELDVMFSKDREIVVIHDETLDRTTNESGDVKNFTLGELKKLDAGSWFDLKFKGENIPSLDEVFSKLGDKILINVEIKPECYEENCDSESIERKVIDLVYKYRLENRVIISSFNFDIIKKAAGIDSGIKKAFILDIIPDNFDEIINSGIFSVHSSSNIADVDFIGKMHGKGIMVFVWTVNEPEVYDKLIKNGVDGIFTDNPGYFLKG